MKAPLVARLPFFPFLLFLLLTGCAQSETLDVPDAGASGTGGVGSGGTTGTGGIADSSGGINGSGGTSAPGTGGASGSSTGSGGAAGHGSGGLSGQGGTVGSGGVTADGGAGGRGTGGHGGSAGHAGSAGAVGTGGTGGALGPTFTAIYNNILLVHCGGSSCHNPGTQEGVTFSSQSSAYTAIKSLVTAGKGATSTFYVIVSMGTGMSYPPPNPVLSAGDLATIESWINAGALDN